MISFGVVETILSASARMIEPDTVDVSAVPEAASPTPSQLDWEQIRKHIE